jgi:hypothetical protein
LEAGQGAGVPFAAGSEVCSNRDKPERVVHHQQRFTQRLAQRKEKCMAIGRGLVATAVFAGGLAVGTAGAAWADLPTMNGSYTATSTTPSGKHIDSSWTVNGCGDGCIWVKAGAGGQAGYLVDGQWVLDGMNNLYCPDDRTWSQYATTSHMTWDPNTLAGTSQITYVAPFCGHPAGTTQTNQLQLKASS